MLFLFIEAIVVGFITLILGSILFNLSLNKHNNKKIKPYGICMAFFMTGVIIHLLIEFCTNSKY